MKRIPMIVLKGIAKEFKLTHVVMFAHNTVDKKQYVNSYGKTLKQCDEASGFANRMQVSLGWPWSLQSQPNRVLKLQKRIKELELKLSNK